MLAGLLWSGWQPHDRLTWLMEVLPVMIVLPVLWATYRQFPLTNLLLMGIFLHCAVLMFGGAYTYARVPLGFELQEMFDLKRNPYDKIGHFFQGLVPALAARELYIRHAVVNGRAWLAFLVLCTVLTISAVYELVEWAAALIMGQGADEFLGTQGDIWDTQSDMLLAMIGAITALTLFSRLQDKQISRLAAAASKAQLRSGSL
jgi:putative membrane protein